jgi:transcriptional regulator with XRE-family HTH domain
MAHRLGDAARRARREAGLTLMDVAVEAGVSQSTILNFEQGHAWRRDTNVIVAAYEHLLGLERDTLWRRAINEEGPPPADG